MEATSSYWLPVWRVLEDGDVFERLLLVNARHVRHVPGRKTDVKDATWLCELLEVGLLAGSFVPPPEVRRLRAVTRYLPRRRGRRVCRDRTAAGCGDHAGPGPARLLGGERRRQLPRPGWTPCRVRAVGLGPRSRPDRSTTPRNGRRRPGLSIAHNPVRRRTRASLRSFFEAAEDSGRSSTTTVCSAASTTQRTGQSAAHTTRAS
jgi:hypothetical protein